jgi:hypothetical protein
MARQRASPAVLGEQVREATQLVGRHRGVFPARPRLPTVAQRGQQPRGSATAPPGAPDRVGAGQLSAIRIQRGGAPSSDQAVSSALTAAQGWPRRTRLITDRTSSIAAAGWTPSR